jgi:serine/threonine protein kinase
MTVESQVPTIPGYRDITLFNGGSTSQVFRAVQSRLNRTVAIKVLLVDSDASTHAQYLRELETTVLLSSQPHIVGIIDTGVTAQGNPYIVMEYCPGGSYAQILKQRGPLPVDEVLEIGTKIGEALHAAHEAGILHRDVKPSNILRSAFGPALADFGIARAPHELGGTVTGDRMTPHHASPEAMRKDAQSPRSDVYSLASTMWHLLAGRPPFGDPTRPVNTIEELRQRVLSEPPPPVPRPDVPAWLQQELARALAKDPAHRHPGAHAFAETLRRHAYAGAPGPAPVSGPPRAPAVPQRPGPTPVSAPMGGVPTSGVPVPQPPAAPQAPMAWPESAPTRAAQTPFAWPEAAPTRRPEGTGETDARPTLPGPDTAASDARPTSPASPPGPPASPPAPAPRSAPPAPPAVAQPPAAPVLPRFTPAPAVPPAAAQHAAAQPAAAQPVTTPPPAAPPPPAAQPQTPPQRSTPPPAPPAQTAPRAQVPAPPAPPQRAAPPVMPAQPTPTQPTSTQPTSTQPTPTQPRSAPPSSGPPMSAPPMPPTPAMPAFPPPAFGPPPVAQAPSPPAPISAQRTEPPQPPAPDYSRGTPPPEPFRGASRLPDGGTGRLDEMPTWTEGYAGAPERSRRTWMYVALGSLGVLLLLVGVGAVVGLTGQNSGTGANGAASQPPSPTRTLVLTDHGAPRDVKLVDNKTSIDISWTDPTGGTVQFAVLGGPAGTQPVVQKLVDPGTVTLTLNGINAKSDYCYRVVAFYSATNAASSDQICTHRKG